MPKDRKRAPKSGRLWSLDLIEDDAPISPRVAVRLGARLVATIPGRVTRITRLEDGKLALALEDGKLALALEDRPPVLLDLFTGETISITPASPPVPGR